MVRYEAYRTKSSILDAYSFTIYQYLCPGQGRISQESTILLSPKLLDITDACYSHHIIIVGVHGKNANKVKPLYAIICLTSGHHSMKVLFLYELLLIFRKGVNNYSWLCSVSNSTYRHIHVLSVGLFPLYERERERASVVCVCACIPLPLTTLLTDWPLTSHLFLLPLSVQRGAKPKKVLHVSLISLNVDHPTHTTASPRAAACCQTLL